MKDRKKRNDIILAVVMILVATAGFFWYNVTKEEGSYVALVQNGTEVKRFTLKENREYRVEGKDGSYNVLYIQDAKVYMKEASCPDQICVEHRAIQHVGETIVCLPNEIVLKVVKPATETEIDMVI